MIRIDQPAPSERIVEIGTLASGDLFVSVHTGGVGHGVFCREIEQIGPAPDAWERAAHLVNTIRADGQESNQFAWRPVMHVTPEEAASIRAQVATLDALPTA